MRNLEKYKGVIPAFYACYDNEGNVSPVWYIRPEMTILEESQMLRRLFFGP